LTLLETMLAIALSAFVLYLVSMAIDVYLGSLDKHGVQVEEAQLARAVLQLMAADLRNVVYVESTQEGMEESAGGDMAGDMGDQGSTSGQGQPSGSGASSGSLSGSSGSSASSSLSSSSTLSDLGYIPTKMGLYGTQYEIQIDVSRLPRSDQYVMLLDEQPTSAPQDMVSEVKTIAYYVEEPSTLGVGTAEWADERQKGGLFRRVLDKKATVWAAEQGNLAGLEEKADLIAPEIVALEFRYFDGLDWYSEWDSEICGGLPAAVEITLAISMTAVGEDAAAALSGLSASGGSGYEFADDQIYRLLVRLPTAEAMTLEDTYATEETDL
jgi:hypothetical protein